jgi:flagellar biosynthesis chaperone FliJ
MDELRKDRFNFKETIKAAGQTRQREDDEMSTLITESNNAYSERDRRKMELARLRGAEKADVTAFEEKVSVLDQTIETQKVAASHQANEQPLEPVADSGLIGQQAEQDELALVTSQYERTTQVALDLCHVRDAAELFATAERLERENFSLYSYVVEHGAARARLQEDIDGLELQRDALLAQTASSEEEQSLVLQQLTDEIQRVDGQLRAIEDEKAANETQFQAVYEEIEAVFTCLGCSWNDAPDGKTTTTPANSSFCLSSIETVIAQMANQVYQKTKMEALTRPEAFAAPPDPAQPPPVDPAPPSAKHPVIVSKSGLSPEKEGGLRVVESNKPLSLDELRRSLESWN